MYRVVQKCGTLFVRLITSTNLGHPVNMLCATLYAMNCADDLILPGSSEVLDPVEFGNKLAVDASTVRTEYT